MPRITAPPEVSPELLGEPADFFKSLKSDACVSFVQMANDRYLHWHKLKFLKDQYPAGMTPAQAWFAVDFSRAPQRRELQVEFEDGDQLSYWSPPQHLQWLHKIDHLGGGMMGSTSKYSVNSEQSERYLISSLMEEAIASSQLEGATTTRKIAKEMLRRQRSPKTIAERMIINNYRAIMEIRDLKSEKLTPELLLHLQKILTDGTLDDPAASGRFRTEDDEICVVDVRTDEVLHEPPHASSVKFRIEEICDFANDKPDPFVHPVLIAIALHFAIGFVHPFVDGNGRTARSLFYWYMLKHDYWLFEYLPISRIFLNAPAKYGRSYLYTETDKGDLTYFIHYNLHVINRAIGDLQKYLKGEQSRSKQATEFIRAFPEINQRQASALCYAVTHPDASFDIATHKGLHQIGYATARKDLLELVNLGFFEKILVRNKAYVFHPVGDFVDIVHKKQKSSGKQVKLKESPSPSLAVEESTPLFDWLESLEKDSEN